MWCKKASHFKLSFQWQVLGFQQLLWNSFNWSSMKIWGVHLKFTSQTHPDFIKDLIFLYLPIKYMCVCMCINQYLLYNWFFFLKEQFPISLWRMNSTLCMQWEIEGTIHRTSFLPTPSPPPPQAGIWSTWDTYCFPRLTCVLRLLWQSHDHLFMAWLRTA